MNCYRSEKINIVHHMAKVKEQFAVVEQTYELQNIDVV